MTTRPVRFSTKAESQLLALIQYLQNEWGGRSAIKLQKKIKASEFLISRNPYLFPHSATVPALRKCVVTKQTSLFYAIEPKEILIVAVFDTRQNPTNLRS